METRAECITNYHGRILRANGKFCRMFGLRPEDAEWHYQQDLHRDVEDWHRLQDAVEATGTVHGWTIRLRNRKGRSFPCLVDRVRTVAEDGRVLYTMRLEKLAHVSSQDEMPMQPAVAGSVVYLTVCDGCGKVKDPAGNWVEPMHGRPASLNGRGIPNYCPACSAHQFPGLSVQSVAAR